MSSTTKAADYSLQSRLLMSFSILLFIFLGLTGIVLDRAFINSVEAGAADRLQVQIYLLLAAAEEEDGEFYFLEDLQEPRFSQLDSGLYGFISSASFGELWRSDSALAYTLPDAAFLRQDLEVGQTQFSRLVDAQQVYFVLSYGILWQDGISEYSFSVVEDAAPYYSEISNFRNSLWYWLGGVGVVLLFVQFLLLRWGLLPLHRMARDLKQIESGDKEKLEGVYTRELQGVTHNLNLLIESERKQQDRYRTTLGDLAHSLKTPIAVIAGILPSLANTERTSVPESGQEEKQEEKQKEKQEEKQNDRQQNKQQVDAVAEQLERMNQIVSYQLQRAVQTNNASSLAKQVNAAAAVSKVLEALAKVYRDKAIEVESSLDPGAVFSGDERDLMEVTGNVLDNAFKYGRSKIHVVVDQLAPDQGLQLIVEDDGPGIDPGKQEFVLQRGARADTLVQGQGIGLAVVTDIVNSYGGDINISTSDLGGARIEIEFNHK